MDEPGKTSESDSAGNVGSPRTPAEKARAWTQEEMEAALPCPMPEVPDDEAEVGEVATPRITEVRVSHDRIVVDLNDGKSVSLPLHGFPGLLRATEEQRDRWSVIAGGTCIRWDALDEELSLETILARRHLG